MIKLGGYGRLSGQICEQFSEGQKPAELYGHAVKHDV
jgi:hypothetical protein